MADQEETLRDWHRLFGLLLTDLFTDSPFTVEVERDLSVQQQFLDVVIVRKGEGEFNGTLPDGLGDLAAHNLITFKSHHEALDRWAMKELVAHSVAYRKFVSPKPTELLPEDAFRLYAVCARSPQDLPGRVPWQKCQDGVYDCLWGTDSVRVVVAGELPRKPRNAPLHLFSASPQLIGFGQGAYQRRSSYTSQLLGRLFGRLKEERFAMAYTWLDFERDYAKKYFPQLSPEEQQEVLCTLPVEVRLGGLTEDQIRAYLEKKSSSPKSPAKKPRKKK
jgi:hypothetical protein